VVAMKPGESAQVDQATAQALHKIEESYTAISKLQEANTKALQGLEARGAASLPNFDQAVSAALEQVQKNYAAIGTLQETAAAAAKQLQDSYARIGTFSEAAANALRQTQEGYDKIGSFQDAVRNAYQAVRENYQNIGKSSPAALAAAFQRANKPVPEGCDEAGALLDEFAQASLAYQEALAGRDLESPGGADDLEQKQQDFEAKINDLMDQHGGDLEQLEALVAQLDELPADEDTDEPTQPELGWDELRADSQVKIDQYYQDERDQLDEGIDLSPDLDASTIIAGLDAVKQQYERRVDEILESAKGKLGATVLLDPNVLAERFAATKAEYGKRVDEILAKYKTELAGCAKLYGARVKTQEELLNLPLVDLLARTIFAEQSNPRGGLQNALAWNIVNKSGGNLAAWLIPSKYECLRQGGQNQQAYAPDTSSAGWKNALDLAQKIISGDTASIPNPIGTTKEFRTTSFFQEHSHEEVGPDGKKQLYFDQRQKDGTLKPCKVKDVTSLGGNTYFNFE